MPIQQNNKFKKIKHKSCNNRVKLTIIPKYSITNTKVNSTLTITIQKIIQ